MSVSRGGAELALFRAAPSRESGLDIKALAAAHPGSLYMQGVAEVGRILGAREGASGNSYENGVTPRFVQYLLTSFHGKFSAEKTGIGKARELRTLAAALDHFGRGEVAQASDLLMQRFKAVTAAVEDGNWALAQRYELIPESSLGLIGTHEKKLAARDEALALRLAAATTKRSAKHGRAE